MSDSIMADKAHIVNKIIVRNKLFDPEYLGDWLTLAASGGRLKSMRTLIERGANVNYANNDGETPFSYTCAYNQFAAAQILHQNGANINTTDKGGGTPHDWAVCWCSPNFRKWLKSIGGIRNTNHEEWDWEAVTKPALEKHNI